MRAAAPLLALLVLPAVWWLQAGDAIIGFASEDLEGHLWTLWNATQGPMTRSALVNAPVGVDLLPIVGGWLDIRLGSWLAPPLGPARAYNAVLCLYGLLAGLGGALLARSLGAAWWACAVAGLVLQLDPFVLLHLSGGRPEQAALGLVALALAGAVGAWRTADRGWVLLAGVAGALVVFASWELAILLALGMGLAVPILRLGLPAAPGVARRWATAAGVTALFAGPWVATFLARTLAIRAQHAPELALDIASHASIGWLQYWLPGGGNPGLVPVVLLLALPVFDRDRRRLWLGVWGVLLLTFALGLGPRPAAYPGGPSGSIPGLFDLLQGVPVLRWFHWPDRIVSVWGVLAAGATGHALSVLAGSGRKRLSVVLGVAALGVGLLRVQQAGRWPVARYTLPESPLWDTLAADDHAGALFDLPVRMKGIAGYAPGLAQMHHGRAVRSYGGVPWLLPPPTGDFVLPDFAMALDPRRPVPQVDVTTAELDTLRGHGFGYVTLQRPRGAVRWYTDARAELARHLGTPDLEDAELGWVVWRL